MILFPGLSANHHHLIVQTYVKLGRHNIASTNSKQKSEKDGRSLQDKNLPYSTNLVIVLQLKYLK